jgi:death-on-curing protein
VKRQRWVWVPLHAALAIHDQQISEHGGIGGVRDVAGIESALARPRNLCAYGKPDAATLAAAYAFGLCNHHGFLDGSKRTAYVVAETFLDLNRCSMEATDKEVVNTMLAVASGRMPEARLAEWFRSLLTVSEEAGAR